ncbi:tetratricopeptide repeat protein [Ascidiimonas sp. W6]|uniref:tetratricopeptide repeat protein n=1 Tax=Ascidiimonas meishanensis TaxID=3128903 RepID=UPI0030EB21FA
MQFSSSDDKNLPIDKFESMLKTDDVYFFDSEDFEEIIHHYLDSGKVSLAKKAIKIGLQQHPDTTNLKLLQIEVFVFEDKLETAESMLNALLAYEHSNEEIYIQKANIYSKKDNHQKAIDLLKTALIFTEEVTDIYLLIGMEYLFMDNYASAKEYFIKCLQEDPQDYASLYNTVYCFEFLEDHDGAINFLNEYLENNPYCDVAWHQLGKQFFEKEMFKEALASFDFAIIADDTFVGAYLEKGKVLEKLNRHNEAIENYEVSLSLDDPTSFAYLRIGKCHEKLGNTELAQKFYYKTVHEDPLLDKGWLAITNFYFNQENYQKARYYIDKAINIDSENVLYWKLSAQINQQLKRYEEADIAYKKTVELGNYELETWIQWSDVLLKLGEYNTGVITLLQAFEFYPEKAELEFRIAGFYFALTDSLKGTYHLKNALRNDYKKVTILQMLFPEVFIRNSVRNIITKFKNASL